MNLIQTIQGLEAKGVTVAINLGVHEGCLLDSNCPLAIQLRRLIADSGTTLEELLEGFQEVTTPDPVRYELPQFDANLHLNINGKEVEVDFSDVVSEEMRHEIDTKRVLLKVQSREVTQLGHSLYNSYLNQIARSRDNHTLPQLGYSVRELAATNCSITSRGGDYIFLFGMNYNPQYIITDGVRYKLADEDIRALKRSAFLEFQVTPRDKIIRVRVLDGDGSELNHYHGVGGDDCWGAVTFPETWDRSLPSLHRIAQSATNALYTINKDSMLASRPDGMIYAGELFERSTELGREGEFSERTEAPPADERWGRAGWGRGRREQGARTQPVPAEEEVLRRFGVTQIDSYDLICILCDERAGSHYMDGTVCPRDHHRGRQPARGGGTAVPRTVGETIPPPVTHDIMVGFGTREPDMDRICDICGDEFGSHFGAGNDVICPRDWR